MVSSSSRRSKPFSERLYRLLLLSYPGKFREGYRAEMEQTFRDCRRAALQSHGAWGLTGLWGLILYDLATSVFIEHLREFMMQVKRFSMFKESENMVLATQFNLNVAQRTDVGRQRQSNEDNMTYVIPEVPEVLARRGALFVVADGLGGHTKGEVASELAVRTISDAYYHDQHEEIEQSLQQAIKQANFLIYNMNQEKGNKEHQEMGTTCVVAVLQGDMVHVANVGDSRAYIARSGQVRQVSIDHSIVAEELRAGIITKDQVRDHPKRNMITRCLGIKPDVEVDISHEQVQQGDLLILCTDGLSNLVGDEELGQIVQQFEPQESVQHLIERANEQGGPDNITAEVVRVSLAQSSIGSAS